MNFEQLHLTADKREIKDFPKFAYRRTSFIRKPFSLFLGAMAGGMLIALSQGWAGHLEESLPGGQAKALLARVPSLPKPALAL